MLFHINAEPTTLIRLKFAILNDIAGDGIAWDEAWTTLF